MKQNNNQDEDDVTLRSNAVVVILSLLLFLYTCSTGDAQTVTRNGDTFSSQTSTKNEAGQSIETKYSYQDTDGKTYTIWLSKNGHAYILKTSKKTGNEYKKYLGEEISRTICTELGVEYKETTKK